MTATDTLVVDDKCFICLAEDGEGAPYEFFKTLRRTKNRGPVKCYRCVDREACDRRVLDDLDAAAEEYGTEIREGRETIASLRQDIARAEEQMRWYIREAIKEGVSVTKLAKFAGLSRERVYQIRDGRR